MRTIAAALLALALAGPAHAAEDYCAYGTSSALLLVDRTTAFDDTDKTLLLQALDQVVGALGPGDRFVVFTMTGAFTDSRKIFDRCKPACPDAGFFAGLLSSCSAVVARSQLVGFTRELAQGLAALLAKPEETRYSDLFRTIAEDVRAEAGGKPVRTLILFSDLIENSPMLSERDIKRLPPDAILKRLAANGVQAGVQGATVRVFGFGRDDSPARPPLPQAERQRIAEAWRGWFMAGGAENVDIGFR